MYTALMYGPPGGGKTRLAGSSPGRTVIINCDGLGGPESIRQAGRTDLEVLNCERIREAEEVVQWLRYGSDAKDVQWAWLDTITLLQESEMTGLLAEVVAAKPHRDLDVPDMPEYLKVQNRLKKLVREMISLPCNVGITAHEMRIEDSDTGDVQYWPAIAGKQMPQKISGYVGLVARMTAEGDGKERKTRLRLQGSERVYARNRYGAGTTGILNPTMPKLLKVITN